MIRMFKYDLPNKGWDEIRIIDTDKGQFTHYYQDRKIGFAFNKFTMDIVNDMGYQSPKACMKELKSRKTLGHEINYEEQRESEKIGLINLGVYRINKARRVNTLDFDDVIERLADYGFNYCDAQNSIIAAYEYSL